ncbi:MAG: hypothetical protein MJZ34_02560 [Paludibacteraceae bacterium]|nr:hypothetical protein [Paludibacteraceae bacterium]
MKEYILVKITEETLIFEDKDKNVREYPVNIFTAHKIVPGMRMFIDDIGCGLERILFPYPEEEQIDEPATTT